MKQIRYLILFVLLSAFVPAAFPVTASPAAALEKPNCALLGDAAFMAKVSAGFELRLRVQCGQLNNTGPATASQFSPDVPQGTDVLVNNPTGDPATMTTQSEVSFAQDAAGTTLCAGFNDSAGEALSPSIYTGWATSTDGGATWTDKGMLAPSASGGNYGDPSMVWSAADNNFYFISFSETGIGVWKSTDHCATLPWLTNVVTSSGADKMIMAVDNNPASPYYGRLYVSYVDFNVGSSGTMRVTYSSNGGTSWSTPANISSGSDDVQDSTPVVAPNGDVFVGYLHYVSSYPGTQSEQRVYRSTDGGTSYTAVTSIETATAPGHLVTCGFGSRPSVGPASTTAFRIINAAKLAMGPDGVLHAAWFRNPGGTFGSGDQSDVYYARSSDNGATWSTPVRINDDTTTTDQWNPAIGINANNIIAIQWLDAREDAGNSSYRAYGTISYDGGTTWEPNFPIGDVMSGRAPTNPNFDPGIAACYHGEYNTTVVGDAYAGFIWSDDRAVRDGHPDPDIYFDRVPLMVDFALAATPDSQSVCAPASASYTINVAQILGFNSAVTLTQPNPPAGATASFVPNPVTPPGTSVLTVGPTSAEGAYSLDIVGTTATKTHTTTVGLTVYAAAAGAPTLTAPADGATDVSRTPTFTWTPGTGSGTYHLQVATDSGFTNIVIDVAGLTAATYTAETELNTSTTYYWRVTTENACGNATSATFSFTTVAGPGDCALGQVQYNLFLDDMEGGAGAWAHSGTGDTWAQSTAKAHSPTHSWFAVNPAALSDQRLVSPAVVLPSGRDPLSLKFWHDRDIEESSSGCYDGGILEISTDAGATWTQMVSQILTDPYDGAVSTCCSNPLQGLQAWCGAQAWTEVIVDMSGFAGQTVQWRYRLGSDSSVGAAGWYVDDVQMQACLTPTAVEVAAVNAQAAAVTTYGVALALLAGAALSGVLVWRLKK